MKLLIGSDHRGFALKEVLKKGFPEIEFVDVGTNSTEMCDYPDIAETLCTQMQDGSKGVLICGSGGISVAANKFPGIRATLCYKTEDAKDARFHTNANVLVLSADNTAPALAKKILKAWLEAPFDNIERRVRRLEKLKKIEEENFKQE